MKKIDAAKKFAQYIKKRRKELKMTQTQLNYKATGQENHTLISDIERGKRNNIETNTINTILEALGSDVEFVKQN